MIFIGIVVLVIIAIICFLVRMCRKHKYFKRFTLFVLTCLLVIYGINCVRWFRPVSEETHLAKITEKVQKNFIENEKNSKYGYSGFTVQIIPSLDGIRDCFVIEFEPKNYMVGRIFRNNYYIPSRCWLNDKDKINIFSDLGIEKENLRVLVYGVHDYLPIFASEEEGKISLYIEHYDFDSKTVSFEIKELSQTEIAQRMKNARQSIYRNCFLFHEGRKL